MVLDRILAIKIKHQDNSYSERIPIGALAQNIQWDASRSLTDILGNVKNDETIQGQIDDLYNNKISANSLNTYVGTKLQEDAAEWLKQNINPNEVLKKTDLYSDNSFKSSQTSMEPTEVEWRQYPVVRDQQDNLSVNVPWTDTDTPADMQNIWSGICSTDETTNNKIVVLDKTDNFKIEHGAIIAVYFTMGNTIQSPAIIIQGFGNTAMPIYYAVDGETILEMDVNTPEPWYTFTPGLKFFTCRKVGDKLGWLLTTVDYSLISHLNQTIAKQDSPEFSGTPTAPTAAAGDNSNQIATTKFVHDEVDNILSNTYLKTNVTMPVNSQNPPASPSSDRQYPVVKDNEGKLSVNVPWSVSDADAAVQHIWTGVCNTMATAEIKNITLDNGNNFSVVDRATLIVYFTNGNTASTPSLNINNDVRNILYQTDANTLTPLQATTPTAISNWGPGLKIFTFNSRQNSIGWIMQSPDMASIRYLLSYKADLNSPTFTGSPTAPTPAAGDNSTKLATTAFVSNIIENNSAATQQSISEDFNTQLNYEVGDYIYYNNKLYRFVKSHTAGEWVASQVEPVSITDDLQNTKQTLNNILVNNKTIVTLQNNDKAKLSSISSTSGFIRTTNNTNLVEFEYSYSGNIDNPTVSLPLSLGTGKWLVGFKIKITPNPVVTSNSNYGISWVQGSTTYEGQLNSWINISKYLTNLNAITLRLIQYPNVNYNPDGHSKITLSIKDLYIYNLDNLDVDIADNTNFKNYIISEQNRDYQSGTAQYSLPDYGTDKTLTQYGKAADAKAVGDMFNNVLVETENDKMTVSNWLSLNNQKWQSSNLNRITQYSSNYIKFNFEITNSSGTGPKSFYIANVPQVTITTPRYVLIGFKYKFYSSNEFSSLKFMKSSISFDEEDVILTNKNQQEWQDFSGIFYKKNIENAGNLQNHFAFAARYENLSSNQKFNVTFEIKDFYIYYFDTNIFNKHNLLINNIRRKQSQDYHDGTVTYQTPKYIPDTSLSIPGKAADAKVVGDIFNDILVKNENEYIPDTSLSIPGKAADAAAVGDIINDINKWYSLPATNARAPGHTTWYSLIINPVLKLMNLSFGTSEITGTVTYATVLTDLPILTPLANSTDHDIDDPLNVRKIPLFGINDRDASYQASAEIRNFDANGLHSGAENWTHSEINIAPKLTANIQYSGSILVPYKELSSAHPFSEATLITS